MAQTLNLRWLSVSIFYRERNKDDVQGRIQGGEGISAPPRPVKGT